MMEAANTFLEGSDNVYRYAWFSVRKEPDTFNGYSDMLVWNNTQVDSPMTDLGTEYTSDRRLKDATFI